jgi:hypothetical protein
LFTPAAHTIKSISEQDMACDPLPLSNFISAPSQSPGACI